MMGASIHIQTLAELEQIETSAWRLYGEACWHPLMTEADRAKTFAAATKATNDVLRVEKAQKLAAKPAGVTR